MRDDVAPAADHHSLLTLEPFDVEWLSRLAQTHRPDVGQIDRRGFADHLAIELIDFGTIAGHQAGDAGAAELAAARFDLEGGEGHQHSL